MQVSTRKGFIFLPVIFLTLSLMLGTASLCRIWNRHQQTLHLYTGFFQAQNAAYSAAAFIQSAGNQLPVIPLLPASAAVLLAQPQIGTVCAIDETSTVRIIRTPTCFYAIGTAFEQSPFYALTVFQIFTTLNSDQSLSISKIKKFY